MCIAYMDVTMCSLKIRELGDKADDMHYMELNLWFNVHKHSNLLVLWFISYITCTIVLLVSKVTGLQDSHIETHSIEPLMVSDTLDGTGF